MAALQFHSRTDRVELSAPDVRTRLSIREATEDERERWDDLVEQYKNCLVVHTRAWIQSLTDSGLGTPLFLVFERAGRPAAYLPGLIVRVGFLRVFGSPLPGWQTHSMGPVFDENETTTSDLIDSLVPYLERRHGVHHVEIVTARMDREEMQRAGFRGSIAFTYRAPMYPEDEAGTFKRLRDSARRNVRRASRLELEARFETDDSFVDEHFEQVKEVFINGGNVLPFGKDRVLACFRNMRASGSLAAISVYSPDGTNVASGIFTIHGREMRLWSWAHRRAYRRLCPTELMTWTVMQKAMRAGCDTIDFTGRGEFKTRFGAEPDLTIYRWVRSRYRWLTLARDIAEKGYRWQQGLRGRLARRQLREGVQPNIPEEGRHD